MAALNTLKDSVIKHVMLFGPPKSGKTLRAGKLAKYKKLIWIDIERGYSTLFQLPPELQANIELIHIPDSPQTPMAIESLLKIVKGVKCVVCTQHGKVACPICTPAGKPSITLELNALDNDTCVVIDSATQLVASALAHITKGKPDTYKLERDDWGNLKKLMETFYSYIQTAPYNCIVISHEDEVEMVDKSKKLVPVGGSSNFSRNVAKFFDEVIYCRVQNGKHIMASSTASDNNILTGSRSHVDLGKIPDANLMVLWDSSKPQ